MLRVKVGKKVERENPSIFQTLRGGPGVRRVAEESAGVSRGRTSGALGGAVLRAVDLNILGCLGPEPGYFPQAARAENGGERENWGAEREVENGEFS